MTDKTIDAKRLRTILDYNPADGIFRWIAPTAYKTKVGAIAGGALRTGHIRIRIAPHRYMAHRLAWLYVHGDWPAGDIDHIDGNPSNNRIDNLRIVTRFENMQNQRHAQAGCKSGFLGVTWCPRNKRWRAQIQAYGRRIHLGLFPTPETAHAAYIAAKRIHHQGNTL